MPVLMKKAPVIGVTTHGKNEKGSFHIPATYADCVRRAGGIPLLIPPGEENLEQLLTVFDGFVFTGGGDISPDLYGGNHHQSIYGVDESRDAMEMVLARLILGSEIPTLAICRGLQIFTVVLGGTLKDDILESPPADIVHRNPKFKPSMHTVTIGNSSGLSQILKSGDITCASVHHQAVNELPPETEIVAFAPDAIIEALEFKKYPNVVAVQWHPEITAAEDTVQQSLFDDLVRRAGK